MSACAMRFSVQEIPSTNDHRLDRSSLPRRCEVVQIGINVRTKNHREIKLSRDHLEWLTVDQLAALALHENLHGYFDEGLSTLAVRQMVMFAFSKHSFLKSNTGPLNQLIELRKPINQSRIISD
jgi:hypothetical protein